MKIGLDVDGCIANFYKAVCERYDRPFERVKIWEQPWITENWSEIERDMEMWDNLEVLNTVDFHFDYYITSIPEHIKQSRLNWLERNGFPQKPLYVSHNKVKTAEELGVKILIDDKPSTIEAFVNAGLHAIHYLPHYSEMEVKSPYYTENFSEIEEIINKIKEEHYGDKREWVQHRKT